MVPDEYMGLLGLAVPAVDGESYTPIDGLFDYQRDITALAIRKRKFAVFADCGLGKTPMALEFARTAQGAIGDRKVMIVSPLMVVSQTHDAVRQFYGDTMSVDVVKSGHLESWVKSPGPGIGLTNYDALTDAIPQGNIGAMILDESSMLKSHYGKWGQHCIRLGKGLDWKLALTGTPAPNDRIEYANHAVFLDAFPTVNSFLAKFFINRGQTDQRWEMKPHAVDPFYRALSHWCIFLTNPATYGWKDNVTDKIPPIVVNIHDVGLTKNQKQKARDLTGSLFMTSAGGIGSRAKLARIGKTGDSLKPIFIRDDLIGSWPEESTIVWCRFNDEQETLAKVLPGCGNITGATRFEDRAKIINDFKAGRIKTLVTKPKILGFGLNLQVATRHVFSSLHDSYEEYYQAIKRSNRVGSTKELNVHIPVTDVERPMVENVLRKASMVEHDTREQERIFKNACN